jgi:hypothetical protein
MAMRNLFANLLDNPGLFADRFDFGDGTLHFCRMNKKTYAESPWLDQRKLSVDGKCYRQPINAMLQYVNETRHPARQRLYIFHTSHCCSTLLARCLNALPGYFALKEPVILRQLSELQRSRFYPELLSNGKWNELLRFVTVMLSRTFTDSDLALIKATSTCNNLMDQLLADDSSARGIFLYANIRDFLISMFKEEVRLRIYLEDYYPLFVEDMRQLNAGDWQETDNLSIPRKVALMWVARVKSYTRCIEGQSGDCPLVSLDCSAFLAKPAETIRKISDHFHRAVDSDQIDSVVNGPLLKREAKFGRRAYSKQTRIAEAEHVYAQFKAEIDEGIHWAGQWFADPSYLERLP